MLDDFKVAHKLCKLAVTGGKNASWLNLSINGGLPTATGDL